MNRDKDIKMIKEDIETQRERLNNLVVDSEDKNQIIRISEQLDLLINKYYSTCSNKKIAE